MTFVTFDSHGFRSHIQKITFSKNNFECNSIFIRLSIQQILCFICQLCCWFSHLRTLSGRITIIKRNAKNSMVKCLSYNCMEKYLSCKLFHMCCLLGLYDKHFPIIWNCMISFFKIRFSMFWNCGIQGEMY